MNIKRGFAVFTAICTITLLGAVKGYASDVETIKGYIFPEIDFKYVDFMTDGHLHKNKPRYGKYDWGVVETNHFKIYVYGNKENLYNLYGKTAEETYYEFSEKLEMNQFSEKIQLIICNSARDFEETNMLFGMVPKGLGGMTEMIKWKRVLIAFRDSPSGFRRLLRHELTHRYQGEYLKLTMMNYMFRDVPLWFTEGMAEHMSHQWNAEGDLIMRDAYLNNCLPRVKELHPWYGWLVYKEGEFILHFLADQYKDKGNVLAAILEESTRSKFPEAFKKVTGDSLEEFDRKLWQHIEKRYSPLRTKTDIAEEAKPISDGTLLAAHDNFFITRKDSRGREALFLNWTNGTDTKSKKMVESGRLKSVDVRGLPLDLSPEFGFQEHGASFASSTTLVYTMDIGGRDALVIQNFSLNEKQKLKLGKKKKYSFENVREIQYPVMINEDEVSFVGRDDGVFAELFLVNLKTKSVKKLTSSQRTYRGLTYSKATNSLITSIENETNGSYDLSKYDISKGTLSLLTNTTENEFYATCSPDGKQLLYVSDKGLVHNIYRYNFETKITDILTDAKIGIFRPQWFDKNGMAFNWFSRGTMAVKAVPLPNALAVLNSTATRTQPVNLKTDKELLALKAKIPGVESMTIFDVIVSSDKTKALFLENRKLSMEILKRGDAEIRFHLVDKSTSTILQFTVDKFKKMKHYGSVSLLTGTNILLQKHSVTREMVSDISDKDSRSYEEEVTNKESYIYDWQDGELYEIDTEIESPSAGSNRYLSKFSPDLRYLIWVASDQSEILLYDVIKKEKRKLGKGFSEIQDAVFTSTNTVLVLDKEWNVSLSEINISSDTSKTWEKIIPENVKLEKKVSWYPLTNGTTVFLVVPQKEIGLNVFLFNMASSTLTLAASDIPLVRKAELKNNDLVLTIANAYGLDRTMRITSTGSIETTDMQFPYSIIHSSYSNTLKNKSVLPRHWESKLDLPWRTQKLSKIPRIMFMQGVAGIAVGSNSGIGGFLALRGLAFDEINNKALSTDIYLQNGYGFANIQYYNFATGRSYLLDYWNFDSYRHKMDIGVSQNIFLHEFLNWDVTFKQQQVRNERDIGTIQWWRSKLGTTLSLDTTLWDCQSNQWYCHGPHSGTAIFTGAELGVDHKKGFQTIEFNAEARHHLPITDRSGLALRALAGKSFGPNPTTFIWGGNQSFRGIPLFSQAGDTYLMQSTELRFPILNAVGAIFSGPFGEALGPLTLFMDIRGGLYHDVGDMWYAKSPLFDGHQGFKLQQSAGYFVNVPTILGINVRFNKGLYGKQDWNFWLGYNW